MISNLVDGGESCSGRGYVKRETSGDDQCGSCGWAVAARWWESSRWPIDVGGTVSPDDGAPSEAQTTDRMQVRARSQIH